ncbi:hypothetical protein Bca101_036935 [Brassica carinata]
MSVNRNTSAADKTSNPPPLSLVDYSDDEEQATPQQSQTPQPMSEDLHTAAEQLDFESYAESEPVGSTRKKKNVKEGRSKQSSEAIPEEAGATKARKENRGKAIEVSSGESEEEDESENTNLDEVKEVDVEDMEPSISVKEKEKKIKAPSSATQSNPRKPREKLVHVIPYKKDPRLEEEYLKNQPEAREAAKKAQCTSHPKRTDPSGYVPPRQSPQSAGKFHIIHLRTIATPGQPIDADEAKRALDTVSVAIQQLATAMQTLTSVVGQIASMMYPRGEEEGDDPQQQDDQKNYIMGEKIVVLEKHPKLKGGDCRCKDQMDILIQMQVQQRMEQSLQQRSVRADKQVKMKIAT